MEKAYLGLMDNGACFARTIPFFFKNVGASFGTYGNCAPLLDARRYLLTPIFFISRLGTLVGRKWKMFTLAESTFYKVMEPRSPKKWGKRTLARSENVVCFSRLFFFVQLVEPRLAEMEKAYLGKDFESFGKLTMQDSNQFHATCLDTYPPIFYMNDVSR